MGETSKIEILLDTDVLINIAKPSNPDTQAAINLLNSLEEMDATMYISCITEMEFIQGSKSIIEKNRLRNLLQSFASIYVTEQISLLARDLIYEYSSTHGLLLADALIAATSLQNNLPLLTFNKKHFQFITELKLYSLLKK